MYFRSNDGSKNTFALQTTLDPLKLKKGKTLIMLLVGNEREYSKLKSLYIVFLHSTKLSVYRMGIKFDKDPLALEQNKYLSKIVNVYSAYYLDVWPKNPTNNFKFKNYLFRATSIVKIVQKKSMCIVSTEYFFFLSIIITMYMDSLVTNILNIKANKTRQHRTQNLQKTYTTYCKFCT